MFKQLFSRLLPLKRGSPVSVVKAYESRQQKGKDKAEFTLQDCRTPLLQTPAPNGTPVLHRLYPRRRCWTTKPEAPNARVQALVS